MNDHTPVMAETSRSHRQPTGRYSFELSCPADVDFQKLDDWLESALEMSVPPEPTEFDPGERTRDANASKLLWRHILLIEYFLKFSMVPIFESGSIVELTPIDNDGARYKTIVSLVEMNFIPSKCYHIAIRESIGVIAWMLQNRRTARMTTALFEHIEKNAHQPLTRLATGGRSTLPVLETAWEMDIPFIHLGGGIYQLGWGKAAKRLDRSATEGDSFIAARLAGNKAVSARLMRQAGLPAPAHRVCTDANTALKTGRQLSRPLVVKPTDCEGGVGVTVGIEDEQQLVSAFNHAQSQSRSGNVIVEEQHPGSCHRFYVFEGRVLFVVQRLPVSVMGDGQHTVDQLIQIRNKEESKRAPWLRSKPLPDDNWAHRVMKQAGFARNDVPPRDVWIPLREIESTRWGGRGEDVTRMAHPDNVDLAARSVALFGLQVAGVDIISPDISTPWYNNNAIINEINFAPLFGVFGITRPYVPPFLEQLIGEDGRIPVEVFVGDEAALDAGRERYDELCNSGQQVFLTSHTLTLNPQGKEVHFTDSGLRERCNALLLNPELGFLIVVVQNGEPLERGLPFDRIHRLMDVPSSSHKPHPIQLANETRGQLLRHFERLLRGSPGTPVDA